MKPLLLTMTAFGPFADEQQIDFQQLGHNPLFLINGPTGAGKTSILDAICFVLYGKTTGNEREAPQMRCDYADDHLLTQVTLEFELGERRYLIKRTPDQLRPKARGDGFTSQSAEAELQRLYADGSSDILVASKVSDATNTIEELTGLDVDQFRQVMVLPQGKFRELLLADSKAREKIFSQLFQTSIYSRIEERLKQQAKAIRDEAHDLEQKRLGILDTAGVDSTDALTAAITELTPQCEQAKTHKAAASTKLEQANKQLDAANVLANELTEKARLAESLHQANARQTEMDGLKQQLKLAQLAQQVLPVYRQQQQRNRELTAQQQALMQAEQQLHQATINKQQADSAAEQLPALDQQLQQSRSAQQQAEQLKPLLDSYYQQQQQLNQAQQQAQQAQHAQQTAEQQLQQLQTQKTQLAQAIAELQPQANRQTELQTQLYQLQRQCEQGQQLVDLKSQQQHLQQQLADKAQQGKQAKAQLEAAEAQYMQLRMHWHQGQAALLAQQLGPDTPCPVCGSEQHPNPAHSESAIPTEQQLDDAQQQLDAKRSHCEVLRSDYRSLRDQLASVAQQIAPLCEALQLEASVTLEQVPLTEWQQQATATQQQFATAQQAQQQLNTQQQQLNTLEQQLSAQQQQFNTAQQQAAEQQSAVSSLAGRLSENQCRLPAELQNLSAEAALQQLTSQLEQLTQQQSALATQMGQIQQAQQQAAAALATAQSSLAAHQQQLTQAQSYSEQAEQELATALQQAGFADVNALTAAQREPEQQQQLTNQIEQWQQQCHALAGQLEALKQKLKDAVAPDIAALTAAVEVQQQALQQADEQYQQLNSRLTNLNNCQQKLATDAKALAALDERYRVVGSMADIANGNNQSKLSLQRFVLSVLLDDVLLEASERLARMSKGRYRLLRKEERAKGNRASGLDLEVEDAYSGKVRPVATLSGGESFMAALSLALGLSNVVQAYAGGIKLDTLFIDEGFGSLDQDSLELAIRTLIDLQSSGRMIGVISHVTEMKEQLLTRVDVVKQARGSAIKLVCG